MIGSVCWYFETFLNYMERLVIDVFWSETLPDLARGLLGLLKLPLILFLLIIAPLSPFIDWAVRAWKRKISA